MSPPASFLVSAASNVAMAGKSSSSGQLARLRCDATCGLRQAGLSGGAAGERDASPLMGGSPHVSWSKVYFWELLGSNYPWCMRDCPAFNYSVVRIVADEN